MGASGEFDHLGAVRGRHLEAAAECQLRQADLQLVDQVIAVASELFVALDIQVQVQVAVRAAVDPGVALLRHPQADTRVDTTGHADGDLLALLHAGAAHAFAAGDVDLLAESLTGRAGPGGHDGAQQRLHLLADLAHAVARIAGAAAASGLAPAALTAGP